jgi:hypothetical protein
VKTQNAFIGVHEPDIVVRSLKKCCSSKDTFAKLQYTISEVLRFHEPASFSSFSTFFIVRHPLALWECNFADLEKLPYSSTHRSAELRNRSGRNDLLLKTPNGFLRVPVELSNPLKSHTLIIHMKRQAIQMDFVPVALESPLGDVYEGLQVGSTLRPGWSFLSSKWGSVIFEADYGGDGPLESTSAVRTKALEDSIGSLFLVLVVNLEAGKVELYKADGHGINLYYIDMFEPPTSFKGTIEVVFRNSSKGSTRFQFAALYDSALGRDDILGLK